MAFRVASFLMLSISYGVPSGIHRLLLHGRMLLSDFKSSTGVQQNLTACRVSYALGCRARVWFFWRVDMLVFVLVTNPYHAPLLVLLCERGRDPQ